MPPLTLEQILARSLRLKPAKATHHLSAAIPSSNSLTGASISTSSSPAFSSSSTSTVPSPTGFASAFHEKEEGTKWRVSRMDASLSPNAAGGGHSSFPTPSLDEAARIAYRHLHQPQGGEEEKRNGGGKEWEEDGGLSSHSREDQRSPSEDRVAGRESVSHRRLPRSAPSQEDIIRGLKREAREAKEKKYWFMATRERREAAMGNTTLPHTTRDAQRSSSASLPGMSSQPAYRGPSSHSSSLSGGQFSLLSFLRTALRLESWVEGIEAFCHAVPTAPEDPAAPPGSFSSFFIPPSLKSLLLSPKEEDVRQSEGESGNKNPSFPLLSPLPPFSPTSSSATLPSFSSRGTAAGIQRKGPEDALLTLLLSHCEGAGRLTAVEQIGTYYGWRYPSVLTRAVEILLTHKYLPPRYPNFCEIIHSGSFVAGKDFQEGKKNPASNDGKDGEFTGTTVTTKIYSEKNKSWQVAIMEVLARSSIPPGSISVDVFNHILSLCEVRKDCLGALYVVQSMGPNPLQVLPVASVDVPRSFYSSASSETLKSFVEEEEEKRLPSSSSSLSYERPSPFPWASSPVPPNVVSYASLIAALEQAGANRFASYIVSLLPPQEKKEITASYAALIYLWSQQVLAKGRKHKR